MTDFDSSLPIRTETDGDVGVRIIDSTLAYQWLIDSNGLGNVLITDGTTPLTINATEGSIITRVSDGTYQMAVNTDGSINVIVQNIVSGGEVHDYGATSGTAPATPTTATTYTVTALKTLRIMSFQGAASGAFKMELKVNAVVVATAFGSTAGGSVEITFPQPIEATAGQVVLVEMTNRDKQNMDLYAFINGVEV
jgi:hypothetical protein